MPRTMSERVRDPKWWGEQALHFVVIGGIPVALAICAGRVVSPILGGALGAAWFAAVREFEQRPVLSWGDLAADVAFTIAGGATAGAFLLLLRNFL